MPQPTHPESTTAAARRLRARLIVAALMVVPVVAGTGCGSKSPPNRVQDLSRYRETGVASWYGKPFHGRTTASGERYNMNKMTAAHKTLPFGVVVKVTNLDNGKSVKVRITDRGPFVKGRIIDLSRAAAKKLEMIGPGTARVKIAVVGI